MIAHTLYRSTPRHWSKPPLAYGIFDLSTHEVYPDSLSPNYRGSFYLPFAPLPHRNEAVIFCGTAVLCLRKSLPVRKHGGLVLPGLSSPFVTFSQANASSSWEKARDSANAMFFKIEQEKRYVDELRVADLNYLPIGLSKTIAPIPERS
ncbi:hypothetical protein FACS1894201_03760 [Bacteroidia bacterium]|nr:hypothetical protein FACS1894201_03760 [Bacteroidia bacterium]